MLIRYVGRRLLPIVKLPCLGCKTTSHAHYAQVIHSTDTSSTAKHESRARTVELPEYTFMNAGLKRTCLAKDTLAKPNQTVSLCGWITHTRFVGKGRIFVVLRDHSGTIQLYLSGEDTANFEAINEQLWRLNGANETILSVGGVVRERPASQINSKMETGTVEVVVERATVLNVATDIPFLPHGNPLPEEETRLKHRPIDLRRAELQRNMRLRARLNQSVRHFMLRKDFVEIETPMLFKSTPEGAREFLVPVDRIAPGKAFALPQSPQQFKQMLMAAGFDRYYQIARCFRDEDLRADRQPEFTQLDMEMSFATMEDVMRTMESLVKHLWKDVLDVELAEPFPHITYEEAISTYGTDKPDMRYKDALPIQRVSPTSKMLIEEVLHLGNIPVDPEDCRVLAKTVHSLARDGVTGIVGIGGPSHFLDCLDDALNPLKSFKAPTISIYASRHPNDHVGSTVLGKVRGQAIRILAEKGTLRAPSNKWSFLWVVDFPLLAIKEASEHNSPYPSAYESMHHPFTAPHAGDLEHLSSDPLRVRGQHYDLVLNGCEVGGGSIRIHSANLQEHILRHVIKISERHLEHFAHLLTALRAGCPPHGGMALGLDRLAAIMCDAQSIRDVIAFPKNSAGYDLCVGSPS